MNTPPALRPNRNGPVTHFLGSPLRLLPALILMAACNDPPTGTIPAELVSEQAPSGVGAPGFPLADTLKVRLVDPSGTPRSGVEVSWEVREGGGNIAPAAEATDADGLVAAVWTLGDRPGMNRVRATTFAGASVDFQAMGEVFRVDRLASDWRFACGLVDGALWCWGRYFWANNAPASIYGDLWDDFSPGLVDDTHDFIELAVTANFVCALDQQLAVWCASEAVPQVAQVAGLPPIRGLVGRGWGPARFCGIAVSDSTAWCWPSGGVPAQVPGSPAFARLWTDFTTSCGLRADSTAACWGTGPLGNGSTDSSFSPVSVSGGHRFVELGVGNELTCGRTAGGAVWCWGRTWDGDPLPFFVVPTQVATGAVLLGVEDDFVMTKGMITGLRSWRSADLFAQSLSGLAGVPVQRFGSNGISCVHLAGGEVYCSEEMWNGWTGSYYDIYHPVPPVRQVALTSARR